MSSLKEELAGILRIMEAEFKSSGRPVTSCVDVDNKELLLLLFEAKALEGPLLLLLLLFEALMLVGWCDWLLMMMSNKMSFGDSCCCWLYVK